MTKDVLSSIKPLSNFLDLPTPVQPLILLSTQAWIKRDDLVHNEYGGNKTRKLAYSLADAIASDKKHIVTMGALGTNHGVATAMACQKMGLDCTVLVYDHHLTNIATNNLKAMVHFGANIEYVGSLTKTLLRFFRHPKRKAAEYYFLAAGGTNPVSTLSYVDAVFELKQQIASGECPNIDKIYCPVASAGTLAGLTLGCQLANMSTEVIGIRVVDSHFAKIIPVCTQKTTYAMMQKTAQLINKQQNPVKISPKNLRQPILKHDYLGKGYGVPTQAGLQAVKTFTNCGITIEPTYSGKAAAAFLKEVASLDTTRSNQHLLFWMTFNANYTNQMCNNIENVSLTQLPANLVRKYDL